MAQIRSSHVPTIERIDELKEVMVSFLDQQAADQNRHATSIDQQITPITDLELVELLGEQLRDALHPDARFDLRLAEGHYQHKEEGDSGYTASQHYVNFIEGQINHWLGPLFDDFIGRLAFAPEDRPTRPNYIGEWSHSLRKVVLRLANAGVDCSKFWPGFDRIQVEILAGKLQLLNPGRSKSHSGISRMMADKSRELALGELVGGTEPGILQIMAKLANRVFSK